MGSMLAWGIEAWLSMVFLRGFSHIPKTCRFRTLNCLCMQVNGMCVSWYGLESSSWCFLQTVGTPLGKKTGKIMDRCNMFMTWFGGELAQRLLSEVQKCWPCEKVWQCMVGLVQNHLRRDRMAEIQHIFSHSLWPRQPFHQKKSLIQACFLIQKMGFIQLKICNLSRKQSTFSTRQGRQEIGKSILFYHWYVVWPLNAQLPLPLTLVGSTFEDDFLI